MSTNKSEAVSVHPLRMSSCRIDIGASSTSLHHSRALSSIASASAAVVVFQVETSCQPSLICAAIRSVLEFGVVMPTLAEKKSCRSRR